MRPFKNYYNQSLSTIKNSLLSQRHSMISSSSPALLSTHVEAMHNHFWAYYEELDLAAESSIDPVSQLLFPHRQNSLEKPFLWLGDFHPYLFTNLLRSFLEENEEPTYDFKANLEYI